MITVMQTDELPNASFEVTVEEETKTRHRVSVSEEVYERLTGGEVPVEELVKESFAYLLEREDNTRILSEFALEEIGNYFPGYEEEVRVRL